VRAYDAVFFISFGGPEKQEDILPFLENVTRGRNIPRNRLLDVAAHYAHLGGRSPINEITRQQAAALEKELAHIPLPVYIGQRHWHPFIEDTLQQMMTKGVKRAIGFITAAHRSEASLERYIRAVEEARERLGEGAPEIDYVDPWFDHPLFIEALAARVRETAEGGTQPDRGFPTRPLAPSPPLLEVPWYFIAHSIPCTMAKNSTYVTELRRTAELVAEKFAKKKWALAYSSRSGRPTDPWLAPDVNETIRAAAAQGHKAIFFITIGFIADHVEVLFDQDVEARDTAKTAGLSFYRTATVGTHPFFIRMMAEVIIQRMQRNDSCVQRQSTLTLYREGRQEPAVGIKSAVCFCQPETKHPPCVQTH